MTTNGAVPSLGSEDPKPLPPQMPLVPPQVIDARVSARMGRLLIENEVLQANNEALVAKVNDLLNALAEVQRAQPVENLQPNG